MNINPDIKCKVNFSCLDPALLLGAALGLAPLAAMAGHAAVMAVQKTYVCSILGWELVTCMCL